MTFSLSWDEIFKIWTKKTFSPWEDEEYLVVSGKGWKGAYEKTNLVHLSGRLILSSEREINFRSTFPSENLKIWQEKFADGSFLVDNMTFENQKWTFGDIIFWAFTVLFIMAFTFLYVQFVIIDNADITSALSVYQEKSDLEKTAKLAQAAGMFEKIDPRDITETFADVGGYEKAKRDLKVMARLTRENSKTKFPQGTILYGPPGTGKTLLARAFAREANLPFFQATGDNLSTNIVAAALLSTVENRLRMVLNETRKFSEENGGRKVVLFIDEFDKMGNSAVNAVGEGGGNELLSAMGGGTKTEDYKNIVLVVTTNYLDWFNPAVLRSGRLDNHFNIGFPDKEALGEIIRVFLRKNQNVLNYTKLDKDSIENIFWEKFLDNKENLCYNIVGADIERIFDLLEFCREIEGKKSIDEEVFVAAIDRVLRQKEIGSDGGAGWERMAKKAVRLGKFL
jgi:ATP-dependent 26S proteasome regulatory subunit